jgi:galactoside O-acetyltransferase
VCVRIGVHVYIASFTDLLGFFGIALQRFVSLSARILSYSGNADYSGEHIVNPTVPKASAHVTKALVVFRKRSAVGAGSIIVPSVILRESRVVGALNFVNRDLEPWTICVGVPCKPLKDRTREVLLLDLQLGEKDG